VTDQDELFHDMTAGTVPLRTLHDRLYKGEIVRFAALPEMLHLVETTRAFVEDRFHPHDPQQVHRHFAETELGERIAATQRDYSRSDEFKRAWRDLFTAIGFDPAGVARDQLRLRFQLDREAGETERWIRGATTVGFHRDSWGTMLRAQVNWWAPVYPISAERTFAFYPELWDRPVANSSATFDMAEAMRLVRDKDRTPRAGEIVPHPLESFDIADARPVVIDCGSIIAFSSQHAHAGVPNHSGLTRISLETRTLLLEDFEAGRGAPNVDGRSRWMSPGLFRRLSDGTKLTELLGIEALLPFAGPWPDAPAPKRRGSRRSARSPG
jgi:hypothetical protein